MQRKLRIVIPVLLFLLTGCSDGGSIGSSPAPVSLSVSPANGSVGVGGTQAFTATVTGSANKGVTWSVREGTAGGTMDSGGNYTAPGTIGVYHVIATSQANTTKTATVPVTVHTLVSIAPATAILVVGGSGTFRATVTGAANKSVAWGIQEGAAGGSIDANGNYTAPGTPGTFHVTATSQADGTQAVATVTVQGNGATGTASGTIQ